ncbi:c-type cytochrome [Permianibacter sp. IMCC34836]|uniref:c-type cytochrome n=1 Tax=Permianibacter fluminis TaxID=2738515 RepID=UPI0015527D3F|nr:c-type cytochrome [Permianibacter fluminis]NQD38873.1 c-type cytochrome [Permianibacter fluminis]
MNQSQLSCRRVKPALLRSFSGLLVMLAAVGLAAASATSGAAETSPFSACATCHGKQAEGNPAVRAPALAGLDEVYLLRQLQHFRDGIRGVHPDDKDGAVMRAAVVTLTSDQAMREVIASIKTFPLPVPAAVAAGADLTVGRNYYNGICSACHGGKAEGIPALNSPRLAGQSAEYLQRQFSHFRNKVRGGHASDKYGIQMTKITKAIADDKMAADVAAYIVQMARTP